MALPLAGHASGWLGQVERLVRRGFRADDSRSWGAHLRDALAEDAIVTSLVIGFVGGTTVFCAVSGLWHRWHVQAFYPTLFPYWLIVSSALLTSWGVAGTLQQRVNRRTIPGALLVLVLAAPFHSAFQTLKQLLPLKQPFQWDADLMWLDGVLHGAQPWTYFAPVLEREWLVVLLDRIYLAWLPVFLALIAYASWSSDRVFRQRVLVTNVLQWMVLGTLGAFVFSSAGPCYYQHLADGANPFGPLTQLLEAHQARGAGLYALVAQDTLWAARMSGAWEPFGGISAMPSMPVAVMTLTALAAWQHSRSFGAIACVLLLVIQLASVALGWHYAVDGYVAAAVTFLLWRMTAIGARPVSRRAGDRPR